MRGKCQSCLRWWGTYDLARYMNKKSIYVVLETFTFRSLFFTALALSNQNVLLHKCCLEWFSLYCFLEAALKSTWCGTEGRHLLALARCSGWLNGQHQGLTWEPASVWHCPWGADSPWVWFGVIRPTLQKRLDAAPSAWPLPVMIKAPSHLLSATLFFDFSVHSELRVGRWLLFTGPFRDLKSHNFGVNE